MYTALCLLTHSLPWFERIDVMSFLGLKVLSSTLCILVFPQLSFFLPWRVKVDVIFNPNTFVFSSKLALENGVCRSSSVMYWPSPCCLCRAGPQSSHVLVACGSCEGGVKYDGASMLRTVVVLWQSYAACFEVVLYGGGLWSSAVLVWSNLPRFRSS